MYKGSILLMRYAVESHPASDPEVGYRYGTGTGTVPVPVIDTFWHKINEMRG